MPAVAKPKRKSRKVEPLRLPGANRATDDGLLAALAALDQVLARAVEHQVARLGPQSLLDPWRGMHLDSDDVRALLADASPPAFAQPDVAHALARLALGSPSIARMANLLKLRPIDIAVVLLALAPEIDLRYGRIYAYLQDDIARKRPTVDLACNLFCTDKEARVALIRALGPHGTVRRMRVLEEPRDADIALPSREIVLDALWRNHLLECDEIDGRLADIARLEKTAPGGLAKAGVRADLREGISLLVHAATTGRADVRLVLTGPHGAGKYALTRAVASELGMAVFVVDVRELVHAGELVTTIERAIRASVIQRTLLFVHGAARLHQRDPQLLRALVDTLAACRTWFVLATAVPLPTLHAAALRAWRIDLEYPDCATRLSLWRGALARHGIDASLEAVETAALRFTLSAAQIEQAISDLAHSGGVQPRLALDACELSYAARGVCGGELAQLAQRVTPQARLSTLVTTSEAQAQLREICERVACRERVRRDWTRDCVHARNAGVTALFAGPSGTGKSLAAEAIAGELGFDLFRIDLALVVSKYIGETEKNLDRVFSAAEHANAVLLFDEADALFGKRSEVKDAHDRYANIEIAYLLQKMERFDGLAILATNLKQNLDEALPRRLTFTVNFAFPEEAERARLWNALWPPNAPRAADVDLPWFAHEFALSGGNIRNTILAALHLAAAEDTCVQREHLLHATRREYQKLGKNLARPALASERRAQ